MYSPADHIVLMPGNASAALRTANMVSTGTSGPATAGTFFVCIALVSIVPPVM